jgi:hypothetical protein
VRVLNQEGVLSPNAYDAEKRGVENRQSHMVKWPDNATRAVTNNPVYRGDVVNGKVGCQSYKNLYASIVLMAVKI